MAAWCNTPSSRQRSSSPSPSAGQMHVAGADARRRCQDQLHGLRGVLRAPRHQFRKRGSQVFARCRRHGQIYLELINDDIHPPIPGTGRTCSACQAVVAAEFAGEECRRPGARRRSRRGRRGRGPGSAGRARPRRSGPTRTGRPRRPRRRDQGSFGCKGFASSGCSASKPCHAPGRRSRRRRAARRPGSAGPAVQPQVGR